MTKSPSPASLVAFSSSSRPTSTTSTSASASATAPTRTTRTHSTTTRTASTAAVGGSSNDNSSNSSSSNNNKKKRSSSKMLAAHTVVENEEEQQQPSRKKRRTSSQSKKKKAPRRQKKAAAAPPTTTAKANSTQYDKVDDYCDSSDPDKSCNLLLETAVRRRGVDNDTKSASSSKKVPFEFSSTTTFPSSSSSSSSSSVTKKCWLHAIGPMTEQERRMWNSSLGAQYAAKNSVPANIGRKLGTITRTLVLPATTTVFDRKWNTNKTKKAYDSCMPPTYTAAQIRPPTLAQARKEAKQQIHLRNYDHDGAETEEEYDGHDAADAVVARNKKKIETVAHQIIEEWKMATTRTPGIVHPNWNSKGAIPNHHTNTYSIETIKQVLLEVASGSSSGHCPSPQEKKDDDDDDDDATNIAVTAQTKKLYHLEIPTDTLSVLTALELLSAPDPNLYNVPFIVAVPVLEPIHILDTTTTTTIDNMDTTEDAAEDKRKGNQKKQQHTRKPQQQQWKLTISVYAHRMLFECMTAENLRIVMAALDDDDNKDTATNTTTTTTTKIKTSTKSKNAGGVAAQGRNITKSDTTATILRPLVQSPSIGPFVFGKDPKTRVKIMDRSELHDDDDDDDVIVISDSSDDEDDMDMKDTNTNDSSSATNTLDAFSTEGFLKLIENQGVANIDTIYNNILEPVLYHGSGPHQQQLPRLQVTLLPHQIHGTCWMYQMEYLDSDSHSITNTTTATTTATGRAKHDIENINPSLGLNGLLWERRQFREGDTYYYSPVLGQTRLTISSDTNRTGSSSDDAYEYRRRRKRRPPLIHRGGILADEGLGKTVQAVALIVATLTDLKNQKTLYDDYDDDDDNEIYHPATLVIVPSALIGQWIKEIAKIAGESLVVQFLDHKEPKKKNSRSNNKNKKQDDDEKVADVVLDPNADIVLTTYQALDGGSAKNKRGGGRAYTVSTILSSTIWGRIILDEMQEVRSWTTTISKRCEQLQSDRRWMLSGTPLWESIEDFKGELCFLGLEPFAASNEDGYFDFAIANHWDCRSEYGLDILRILSLVMLRRTKSMHIIDTGMPLLGLKHLTVTFEPVPQDQNERAIYCFLEFLMHTTLLQSVSGDDVNANQQVIRKNQQNRIIFLRLLRELCVSPFLVNGGFGCSSQLVTFNRLMKAYNRSRLPSESNQNNRNKNKKGNKNNNYFYSCDEAIQFLSQVEDVARTEKEYVTDLRVGGGGGVSRRNRAALTDIDPLERIRNAKSTITKSIQTVNTMKCNRSKVLWQWALEGITTGRLEDKSLYKNTSCGVIGLWKWRSDAAGLVWPVAEDDETSKRNSSSNKAYFPRVASRVMKTIMPLTSSTSNSLSNSSSHPNQKSQCAKISNLPNQLKLVLQRGFRPDDKKFFGLVGNKIKQEREDKLSILYKRHPEFHWSHPFGLMFSNISVKVSSEELQDSISSYRTSITQQLQQPVTVRLLGKNAETWSAVFYFPNQIEYEGFYTTSKRKDGVQFSTINSNKVPVIESEIAQASITLKELEAMCKVHPSTENTKNVSKAKRIYQQAKLGLSALVQDYYRPGHVLVSRAFGSFRSGIISNKTTTGSLNKYTDDLIDDAETTIAKYTSIINDEEKTIKRIENRLDAVSRKVESLNTFEALQALKCGDNENTSCSICLDSLGSYENSNGKVLLTRCGHIACYACLQKWMNEQRQDKITCMECRKPIDRNRLICVDPKKVDSQSINRRIDQAKILVQEAATILAKENNYGQLSPKMWEALYLVIELPTRINRNLHASCTAIPGLVLGHLRHAIEQSKVPLHSSPNFVPNTKANIRFPSKLRALLKDLPRDELSVVFASSKSIILHLQSVLQFEGIGCRSLYVGQSEKESECAISDWESSSLRGDTGADRKLKSINSSVGVGNTNVLVLIVQAGAAACGLTLTASSKMFIMEPFRKHQEEKQAYARLHRYGQTREVECKVYYAPVSVESRLLEWRRRRRGLATGVSRASTNDNQDEVEIDEEEKNIYAPLRFTNNNDDDDADSSSSSSSSSSVRSDDKSFVAEEGGGGIDNDDEADEENQTRFLLGLSSVVRDTEISPTEINDGTDNGENNDRNHGTFADNATPFTGNIFQETQNISGTECNPIDIL